MANDYLPPTRLSERIDSVICIIGEFFSYVWLILLLTIVCNVVMRYLFSEGRIELEEIQWHLYSMGFLIGLSYAYQADAHIRIDVLHTYFKPELRGWIELYGILVFLLPFIALVIFFSVPFVESSWNVREISPSPGGLPYRFFIKGMLPLGFVLLLAAVLARLHRVWCFLFIEDKQRAHQ